MKKWLDSSEEQEIRQAEELEGAISRRKLLTTIGLTGAGIAAGALINNFNIVANAKDDGSEKIKDSIKAACVENCVVLATIAELREMGTPVSGSSFYVTDV